MYILSTSSTSNGVPFIRLGVSVTAVPEGKATPVRARASRGVKMHTDAFFSSVRSRNAAVPLVCTRFFV